MKRNIWQLKSIYIMYLPFHCKAHLWELLVPSKRVIPPLVTSHYTYMEYMVKKGRRMVGEEGLKTFLKPFIKLETTKLHFKMEVRLDQTKRVSNVTILLMLFGLVSCYLNFSYYCTPSFQGISELDIKNTLWHLLVPSWFCYGFVWLQFQDMCSLKPVHSWDQLLLFLCSQKSRKVLLFYAEAHTGENLTASFTDRILWNTQVNIQKEQ